MENKRRSTVRRLAAPFILSVGLLPACGGAPTPPPETGNPPGPETTGHDNPPGVESKHENPPAPEASPPPADPAAAPESPK